MRSVVTHHRAGGHAVVTSARSPARGKFSPDRRAVPRRALDANAATVRLDHVPHDREAESSATFRARASGVHAIEALEDARLMLERNSAAGVAHADAHGVRAALREHRHAA